MRVDSSVFRELDPDDAADTLPAPMFYLLLHRHPMRKCADRMLEIDPRRDLNVPASTLPGAMCALLTEIAARPASALSAGWAAL